MSKPARNLVGPVPGWSWLAASLPVAGTVLVCLAAMLPVASPVRAAESTPDGIEFYERKIRPLLSQRCYECHAKTAKRIEAELVLDTRAGILKGGENGPIIYTAEPEQSLLLQVVGYDGDIQMPPAGKLSADELALLTDWVKRGAPLPEDGSAASVRQGIDFAAGRKFWSFQPLQQTSLPEVKNAAQCASRSDYYLQSALEQRGLSTVPAADPRTLIRRASFDLTGLPPRPDEVEAFVADPSPAAYDRVIERLLSSPHYGERWGRYWLDLSRYADGNKTSLEVRAQAWLYRDWIVRALNADLPYDQFVLKQLAADHLPDSPPADLAALGFIALSPEYFKELKLAPAIIKQIVADEWEERIDALGRTFLGLSLACARCHDHKFDPISADDYYALAGVLASTRLTERYVLPKDEADTVRKAQSEVQSLTEQVKKLKAAKPKDADEEAQIAELERRSQAIIRETPHYHTALAHAVDDAAQFVVPDGPAHTKLEYKPGEAIDLALQIRGNPAKPGRVVARRFLTVFASGEPELFKQGSGRLELAKSLVGPAAPLAARVIVNRVWTQHFGRGLVETVSDFGAQGERPSHPELLDDLAGRFIAQGWSLKWLHRDIMLSAAFRRSSSFSAANFAVDPDNRMLWRMNRRRLDIEAWRDSMLAACGNLDVTLGGPPLALTSAANLRRTLYGVIERSDLDDMLRLFDFPDPSAHAPNREPTTTALQQLFVLNGPFMARQANRLASRITAGTAGDPEQVVRQAYRVLFARSPSSRELQLGIAFLTETSAAGPDQVGSVVRDTMAQRYAQALLGGNEFLFVD